MGRHTHVPPGYSHDLVLGINLTRRCNLACRHCNRLIDAVRFTEDDVTVQQVSDAIDLLAERGVFIRTVKFNGGEPTLVPWLVEACRVARSKPNVGRVRVSTNGTTPMPALPRGCRYRISPPDGDEKRGHVPFLVSPMEAGIQPIGRRHRCHFRRLCGIALDREGFTFCLIAGGLGRLLGINVYGDPLAGRNDRVCRHCVAGLCKGLDDIESWSGLSQLVASGGLRCPSPFFARLLRRWRSGNTFPYPLPAWRRS